MAVDFSPLAEAVEEAFGVSVTVARYTPGSYSAATGANASGSTASDTVLADEQQRPTFGTGGAGSPDTQEVVFNIRAAALTNLGGLVKKDDTVTKAGRKWLVVTATLQAGRTIWRVVCRTEKRST